MPTIAPNQSLYTTVSVFLSSYRYTYHTASILGLICLSLLSINMVDLDSLGHGVDAYNGLLSVVQYLVALLNDLPSYMHSYTHLYHEVVDTYIAPYWWYYTQPYPYLEGFNMLTHRVVSVNPMRLLSYLLSLASILTLLSSVPSPKRRRKLPKAYSPEEKMVSTDFNLNEHVTVHKIEKPKENRKQIKDLVEAYGHQGCYQWAHNGESYVGSSINLYDRVTDYFKPTNYRGPSLTTVMQYFKDHDINEATLTLYILNPGSPITVRQLEQKLFETLLPTLNEVKYVLPFVHYPEKWKEYFRKLKGYKVYVYEVSTMMLIYMADSQGHFTSLFNAHKDVYLKHSHEAWVSGGAPYLGQFIFSQTEIEDGTMDNSADNLLSEEDMRDKVNAARKAHQGKRMKGASNMNSKPVRLVNIHTEEVMLFPTVTDLGAYVGLHRLNVSKNYLDKTDVKTKEAKVLKGTWTVHTQDKS